MTRTILALVEGDGIIVENSPRKIRIPIIATDTESSFRQNLWERLQDDNGSGAATSTIGTMPHDGVSIEIFDPKTQVFQKLTTDLLPTTSFHCRLRLVVTIVAPFAKQPLSSPHLPALPWKEFDVNLTDGSFRIHGQSLRIQEVSNAGMGTGLNVWDGSIALAKYLECRSNSNVDDIVKDKRILEVGAGTGLVGIAAAMLGAKQVVMTDLEYSLPNLQNNIAQNQPKEENNATTESKLLPVEAKILDWFHPEDFTLWSNTNTDDKRWLPDLVLASDVVWIDSLVVPLVKTLQYICKIAVDNHPTSPPPPPILMSYQCRSQVVEDLLIRTLKEHNFQTEEIPKTEVRSERIHIFRISYAMR